MPSTPMAKCLKSACPNRVATKTDRLCPEHKAVAQKIYDDQRGSSNSRGYGAKWRRIRKAILARDPVCTCDDDGCSCAADCNKASTDVDHKIPRREGGRDTNKNLHGMCHDCHSRKTAIEDGRWG